MSSNISNVRALPQSKEALLKSYNTRLKEDVRSMLENFEGKILLYIEFYAQLKEFI